ncbi:hypothetical protein AKJ61_01255 [candidate division MSBL1 archaeon SCGC-AAA259B11]|uniref:Uncharacterized protein n=1 Tax=candidate division MSBL1 archaeon SCGC-AAA259B11 TaxID=1698260 RepID=A0A133U7T0_9EURY|nr:hypothetical protein AKJ61_01255 [candidate division MSBL1 archaeon SCGC-AAA259B11]
MFSENSFNNHIIFELWNLFIFPFRVLYLHLKRGDNRKKNETYKHAWKRNIREIKGSEELNNMGMDVEIENGEIRAKSTNVELRSHVAILRGVDDLLEFDKDYVAKQKPRGESLPGKFLHFLVFLLKDMPSRHGTSDPTTSSWEAKGSAKIKEGDIVEIVEKQPKGETKIENKRYYLYKEGTLEQISKREVKEILEEREHLLRNSPYKKIPSTMINYSNNEVVSLRSG